MESFLTKIEASSLLILLLSLVALAFFTGAEAAVVGANRVRIRHLAEEGAGGASAVMRLWEKHDRFFATVILLQNLFTILASSLSAAMAITILGEGGIWVATAMLTVVVVVFGEMTPKALAVRAAEATAMAIGPVIEVIMRLLTPIVWPLGKIPNLFSRITGSERPSFPAVTEGELRMLLDIGTEEGSVDEAQGEMLRKVFVFGDRRARELLTPSTETIALEEGTTLSQFLAIYAEHPHSRFPVFQENIDNILGILFIKDVLMAQAQGKLGADDPVHQLMRPALFVPETKRIDELLAEMQTGGTQMTIIVDEFGSTAGIVTTEQILEEIVGQMGDELALATLPYQSIDELTLELTGTMRVEEANEDLSLGLPVGDYETVAGFVLDILGHIPKEGESFLYRNLKLAITEMQGPKIERIWVTRERKGAVET